MRVSIAGAGYVGLVTGVCLAEKGHDVICVDIDAEKVAMMREGNPPIFEKGLDELLKKHISNKIMATTDLEEAVSSTDITIIAVGTPFNGKEISLDFIRDAARQIGNILRNKDSYHLVVVKSTVIPGTTDTVVLPILEESSGKQAGADFGVGMNPEFLREGVAIEDFMTPDRIVIGGIDDKSRQTLAALYDGFPDTKKFMTNNKTAELIKYASNSFFAMLISFSNEIANLCSLIGGIDAVDVMKGVHVDRRISPLQPDGKRVSPSLVTYLEAGCGFGGSCFPKDLKAICAFGDKVGNPFRILNAVVEVNERQPGQISNFLRKHFKRFDGLKITALGLAFKPGTDDMRESPSIPIINELRAQGAQVTAYDPGASDQARKILGDDAIVYAETLDDAIVGADAIVVLTRWEEFRRLPELLDKVGEP